MANSGSSTGNTKAKTVVTKAQKTFVAEIQARMDLLIETAGELQADTIHRSHAANRIRLVVGEMSEIIVAKLAKEATKGRKS